MPQTTSASFLSVHFTCIFSFILPLSCHSCSFMPILVESRCLISSFAVHIDVSSRFHDHYGPVHLIVTNINCTIDTCLSQDSTQQFHSASVETRTSTFQLTSAYQLLWLIGVSPSGGRAFVSPKMRLTFLERDSALQFHSAI
jgi:hypothetical protein